MRYRKKPVVIDAVQFDGRNYDEVAWFMGGPALIERGAVLIPTLEGLLTAMPGDWVIKGVKGEFYPCKPDIFEQTYEVAE